MSLADVRAGIIIRVWLIRDCLSRFITVPQNLSRLEHLVIILKVDFGSQQLMQFRSKLGFMLVTDVLGKLVYQLDGKELTRRKLAGIIGIY